ncbi:hypothetical protein BUALT_Bualt05G0116400 [Buddleja alternifolia]|uniref:Uncharacterized protein n=1 Tax=Buddleja alternifolia TaxID=168488 RepID=A0AAV6XU90_9LAMI|nr:hypothetical protein BUALT_Bualt05G0116400 [Buddleja alternifolia]
MEKLRMKETLKACDKLGNIGWNYKHGYDDVRKKNAMFLLSIELASVVGSTIGLVFDGALKSILEDFLRNQGGICKLRRRQEPSLHRHRQSEHRYHRFAASYVACIS